MYEEICVDKYEVQGNIDEEICVARGGVREKQAKIYICCRMKCVEYTLNRGNLRHICAGRPSSTDIIPYNLAV